MTTNSLLFIILVILALFSWIWALIDISKSKFIMPYGNTLWLFIIIVFPVMGTLIYFLLKKQITTKEKRKFKPKFNKTNL